MYIIYPPPPPTQTIILAQYLLIFPMTVGKVTVQNKGDNNPLHVWFCL